jgi:hypothetical protein
LNQKTYIQRAIRKEPLNILDVPFGKELGNAAGQNHRKTRADPQGLEDIWVA